jgi:histidyl-tRNA synthetase
VSRLAAALAAGERGENAQAQGPVVVLPFDKEGMAECFALAASVRAAGMAAEVYLGGSGPKAQLRYADKRNAPAAVILGGDERAAGQVTIKDLKLGAALSKQVADNREWREGRQAQVTVAQADMIPTLQRMLQP